MGCPRCSRAVSLEDDCSADSLPPRAHTATGGGRAAEFKASPPNPPAAAPQLGSSPGGGEFKVYGAKNMAHRVLGRCRCLSCPKSENKTVLAPQGSGGKLPLERQRKSFRARHKEKKNQCERELSGGGAGAEVGTWARLARGWGVLLHLPPPPRGETCLSPSGAQPKSHCCRQNLPKVT